MQDVRHKVLGKALKSKKTKKK